jgi:methionyl-tRNA formyltransferase
MTILYAGYRPWAIKAIKLASPLAVNNISYVMSQDELEAQLTSGRSFDAVFLAGWSWILSAEACQKHLIVGVHPSDLPRYAGGTPIQHQILDGVIDSKATLFRLNEHVDEGNIIAKEPLSLRGSLGDVFDSLAVATARLYLKLEGLLPHPIETQQGKSDMPPRRRLTPADGKMHSGLSAREMYDFIRCRENVNGESVYPNSYWEDDTGRVLFQQVGFVEPSGAPAETLRSR